MHRYIVTIGIERPDGRLQIEPITVHARTPDEATAQALNDLPAGWVVRSTRVTRSQS